MTHNPAADQGVVASGKTIRLRHIRPEDLRRISGFPFTVSVHEPLASLEAVSAAFARSGFWEAEAGAVAIVDAADGRLLGTMQFYRSAPCIHGFELGYILHDAADRGRGAGGEAVSLFRDHLFAVRDIFRLQLIIETWNVASWKLAERAGFVREGLLRSAGFGEGDPADCFIYAQTRKDWLGGRDRPVSLGGG